jgi:tetratricopeptide (TPR) repeat protein
MNLARLYESQGDLEKALIEYKAVYKINPDLPEVEKKIHEINIEILRQKHMPAS